MTQAGIYVIRIVATNVVYVGQAVSVSKRWAAHRRQLARGTHHNRSLQAAWTNGGAAAISFELVMQAPENLRPLAQQRWLADQEKQTIQRYRELGMSVNQTTGEIVATKAAESEYKKEQEQRKKDHNARVTEQIRTGRVIADSLQQQLHATRAELLRVRSEAARLLESLSRSTGLRRIFRPELDAAGVASARQRIVVLQQTDQKLKATVERLEADVRSAQQELTHLRRSYWGTTERRIDRSMLLAGVRVRKERIR